MLSGGNKKQNFNISCVEEEMLALVQCIPYTDRFESLYTCFDAFDIKTFCIVGLLSIPLSTVQ